MKTKRLLSFVVIMLVISLSFSAFAGCDTVKPETTETEKPSGEVVENVTGGGTAETSKEKATEEENQNYDDMFNDPYDVFVALTEKGYTGTFEEWVASLAGKDGEDGKDGADGKSAYELAVEKGYEGTVEEWLISLVGAPGE